jgi:AraC-like DNA-binding protein
MPIIRDIIFGAARRGAILEELCKKLQLQPDDLNQTEAKLSLQQGHQVWEEALKLTKDEFLGLHIGEATNPSIVGLVGHLMQSSPDLLTAFAHLEKFNKVVTEMFFYKVQNIHNQCIVSFSPISFWATNYPQTARQAVEQAMSGSLHICKLLTGKYLVPLQINFTYPAPKNIGEYQRVLKGELFFEQKENSLVFKLSDFKLPVIGYNKELLILFKQLCADYLLKLQAQESTADKVKATILQHFRQQIPQLDEVASFLNMTNRSLQRKLQAEGTNFQMITEEIREKLAVELISHNQFTINEIAYMLGYTESSTFRRAFKRWTGKNPKSYTSFVY